jgi:hypothetical protein
MQVTVLIERIAAPYTRSLAKAPLWEIIPRFDTAVSPSAGFWKCFPSLVHGVDDTPSAKASISLAMQVTVLIERIAAPYTRSLAKAPLWEIVPRFDTAVLPSAGFWKCFPSLVTLLHVLSWWYVVVYLYRRSSGLWILLGIRNQRCNMQSIPEEYSQLMKLCDQSSLQTSRS